MQVLRKWWEVSTGGEGVVNSKRLHRSFPPKATAPTASSSTPASSGASATTPARSIEAELTFQITDEKGRPRNFGSVAGGGRYDGLVKRFTGQDVPATGVSIGVDRLLAALRAKGRIGGEAEGPVVVTVMDRDRMADYMAMVGELRQAGIRAEVYLGNPKNFGNQLKYADKRGSPVAVIQGGTRRRRER